MGGGIITLRVCALTVYGEEPDLIREGGSIPVTLTLEEVTGRNVMLLPIGACDDGAHSQNEKINRSNYIKGVRCVFIQWFGPGYSCLYTQHRQLE